MFGVDRSIRAHAWDEFVAGKREAVGLVVDNGDRVAYVPVPNVAPDPTADFAVNPVVVSRAVAGGKLLGVAHSHPEGPAHPTRGDMAVQLEWDLPFAVCEVTEAGPGEVVWWGDAVPIPPLVGRSFVHGVTDCYSIIRDWYRVERGITLPDFPRDNYWWDDNENMYLENFAAAGFTQYSPGQEPYIGSVFLANVASRVINHGGVYLGQGRILHHLQNDLSVSELGGKYLNDKRRTVIWLKHDSHDTPARPA